MIESFALFSSMVSSIWNNKYKNLSEIIFILIKIALIL